MLRIFDPRVLYYHSLEEHLKGRWVPWLFAGPLLLYLVLRYFETELTHFIIPFFPEETDKSVGFYRDFLRLCFNEMLWLTFFLLTTWILLVYAPVKRTTDMLSQKVFGRPGVSIGVTVAVVFIASVMIGRFALYGFANSADEYVYLHQAQTLSQGKLTHDAHPLSHFFSFNHLAHKEGVTVGRFPPGWPLVLALPFLLDVSPLWLNPVLGALVLLLFYLFAKRYYGTRVAIWSVLGVALTGYFIYNAASYFSHISCLLFTIAFVYCFHRYRETGLRRFAFFAGIFLGVVVITRYFTAVLVFLPVMLVLFHQYRWRAISPLFFMGIGALPLVIFLLWYNYRITGNALLPVTVWVDPAETLGFVKGHSVLKGFEHAVRRALLFLYWSSPALLILYTIFLIQKAARKSERLTHPEDYYLLLLFAGYFFYHHPGGNQYGPRFLFEAYPFMTVFVVNKVFKSPAKWPLALLLAGMIYAVVKMPYITEREHQVVEERLDLFRKVEEQKISQAVIFVATHTGIIRPMPPGDLIRNGTDYHGNIIYARDLGERNQELMNFYPERSHFRYVRDREIVEGKLIRLK